MGIFFFDHDQRFARSLQGVLFDVANGAAIDDFAAGAVDDDVFAFFLVVLGLDEGVDVVFWVVVEVLVEAEDGDFGGSLGGVALLG